MGLFYRKETNVDSSNLYTMGHQENILIVGLGNVGKEYTGTRHNIGFECVDEFARSQDFPKWIDKKDLKCQLTKQTIGGKTIILIKPTTYMNESGQAVQAVQHFYKVDNSKTLVLHDELDQAFGQIRVRVGGSSAGNNGIKSLIKHCGDDFARVRIGVASETLNKMDSADFVLAKFNSDEKKSVPMLVREATNIISEYIASGELPHDTRTIG